MGSGSLIGEAAHEVIKEQVGYECTFILGKGQCAVIADVSEDWTTPINTKMNQLGDTVYSRAKSHREDSWNYPYDWDGYLYPYEYRPTCTKPRKNLCAPPYPSSSGKQWERDHICRDDRNL